MGAIVQNEDLQVNCPVSFRNQGGISAWTSTTFTSEYQVRGGLCLVEEADVNGADVWFSCRVAGNLFGRSIFVSIAS